MEVLIFLLRNLKPELTFFPQVTSSTDISRLFSLARFSQGHVVGIISERKAEIEKDWNYFQNEHSLPDNLTLFEGSSEKVVEAYESDTPIDLLYLTNEEDLERWIPHCSSKAVIILTETLTRKIAFFYQASFAKFSFFLEDGIGILSADEKKMKELYVISPDNLGKKTEFISMNPTLSISYQIDKIEKKYLVIYAYSENPESKKNLEFFSKYGMYQQDRVVYLLVVNGYNYTAEIGKRWNHILHRRNEGADFGAWYAGLELVDIEDYDYFFFLNDTVIGPFGDRHYLRTFSDLLTEKVKLTGLSINCHTRPHVQSMFFCTDIIGLKIIYAKIINEEDITLKEREISWEILKYGYNITCILPEMQVDYLDQKNWNLNGNKYDGDPWYLGSYFGRTLTPLETIFIRVNDRNTESLLQPYLEVMKKCSYYKN